MHDASSETDAPAPPPAGPPAPAPLRGLIRVPLVWALCLQSGITYGLHARDTGQAIQGWWSTVPWLIVALHPRLQGRGNFLAFLVSVHLMVLISVEWLRGFGTAAWLVGPLLYWPVFALVWPLVRGLRARWPAFPLALLWPLIMTGIEWLRVTLSPGELALWMLGYSQIVLTKLVQVADLAGVAAVTFWLASIHGLLAEVALALTRADAGRPLRERLRRILPQAAGVLLLMAFVVGYGFARDTDAGFTPGPRLHVLQPNTARSADPPTARRIHDLQVLQTLSTTRQDCDAIIWPENSITVPFGYRDGRMFQYFVPDLAQLSARLGQPILADGWLQAPELDGDFHAAVLVSPDGGRQIYEKVRLLPWTEVVPGRDLVRRLGTGAKDAWEGFIRRFVGLVPRGITGSIDDLRPMVFVGKDGRTWRFGTPICFEIATARVVNRWHRQGVDFLVNQTSEGRLGDAIHETTIAISGFRAIEGRVSVVRGTNDGISALIDPNGRPREILAGRVTGSPINEPGVFWPQVILDPRRPTVYARIGDAFAIACLLATAALATLGWATRPRRRVELPPPEPGPPPPLEAVPPSEPTTA